jgi:hypothetical protein
MPKETEKETEQIAKEVVKSDKCGHVNMQHYDEKGKVSPLACQRKSGHSGDHQATHKRRIPDYTYNEKGGVIKTEYHSEDAESSWGDAAGKKVEEVKEEAAIQMNALQRDMVMTILTRNPGMNVVDAIKQAKASEAWFIPVV